MNVAGELREFGDARVSVKLARREPGLGTVYAVEGEGTCFHVLGLGFFTFLPGESGSLADLSQPLRRVPSVEEAVAGLVLAARASSRRKGKRLEGDTHV